MPLGTVIDSIRRRANVRASTNPQHEPVYNPTEFQPLPQLVTPRSIWAPLKRIPYSYRSFVSTPDLYFRKYNHNHYGSPCTLGRAPKPHGVSVKPDVSAYTEIWLASRYVNKKGRTMPSPRPVSLTRPLSYRYCNLQILICLNSECSVAPKIHVNIWLLHFWVWAHHKWSTDSSRCTFFASLCAIIIRSNVQLVREPLRRIHLNWQAMKHEFLRQFYINQRQAGVLELIESKQKEDEKVTDFIAQWR